MSLATVTATPVAVIRANGPVIREEAKSLVASTTVKNGRRHTTFARDGRTVLRSSANGRYFVLRFDADGVTKVSAHSSRDLAIKALVRLTNREGFRAPLAAVEVV